MQHPLGLAETPECFFGPMAANPLACEVQVERRHGDTRPAGQGGRPVQVDEDTVLEVHCTKNSEIPVYLASVS